MDISFFREFIVLADTCNFQEAAYILHISQATLSKHIQKAENELCVTLFDRTTRNVSLCEGGKIFYTYAKRMVDLYDECNYSLNDIRTHDFKKLLIGFPSSIGQYGIPALLAKFIYCYPDIHTEIINEKEPKLAEFLITKKLNFIFTGSPVSGNDNLCQQLYLTDSLCVLLPYDHPMVSLPYVTFDQLRNEKFVTHGLTSPETRELYRSCAKAGFEPQVITQTTFRSNLVEMVRCGIGITLMGRTYAQSFNMNGLALVDIKPQLSRSIYLQYYKKVPPASSEELFLQYYSTEIADAVYPPPTIKTAPGCFLFYFLATYAQFCYSVRNDYMRYAHLQRGKLCCYRFRTAL